MGAGLGFGFFIAVFFFFFADIAFFIPFFARAGAPRFAFLDFFATVNLPIVQPNYANMAPHHSPAETDTSAVAESV